jgi:hypothetical protein
MVNNIMQIVWDHQAVQELKKTHTVLELETFNVNGIPVTTYCVVPAEKIGLSGFTNLNNYIELHEGFIKALEEENYQLCKDISEHLIGQFGGELDSFYEEILKRTAIT